MAKENVFTGVDWSEAPEWANYWTCDQDGGWWWEEIPHYVAHSALWMPGETGHFIRAKSFDFSDYRVHPSNSLVERPDTAA